MAGTVSGVFLRRFRTNTSSASARKWSVAQVFKSNFPDSLEGLRAHVSSSDYVAVSLRWTGSPAAPWHRVSRLDNLETAYSKAKHAAGKFQVLHFAVCPFEVRASKVVAHPHLIFIQRARTCSFLERIRSRIKQWKNAFEDSSTRDGEPLLRSMRKLISGSEEYGSRPSMTIDVCSQRQVQLALEVLEQFSEDLVPLIIPAKGAGAWAVHVILTSSKEDKNLLEQELQNLEHEQTKAFRGFREVIELISAAQKPIVSHNSLNDFTSIYPMFLAPLPSNVDEFLLSLRLVFPQFFAPVDREVSPVTGSEGKIHGLNVVRICHLFAKLCTILRSASESSQSDSSSHQAGTLERFANIFRPWPSVDPLDESISISLQEANFAAPEKLSCPGISSGPLNIKVSQISDASRDPTVVQLELGLVEAFISLCRFEWHAGYWEPAMGLFQVQIEFSLFCPSVHMTENKQRLFEHFWSSGGARVGGEGSIGWSTWLENEEEDRQRIIKEETWQDTGKGGWTGWFEPLSKHKETDKPSEGVPDAAVEDVGEDGEPEDTNQDNNTEILLKMLGIDVDTSPSDNVKELDGR
ncbi:hypothetical protein NL676_022032 [Syzygium grande]|nr:hypothetical protein NL676_022032 [Syzygium grande]